MRKAGILEDPYEGDQPYIFISYSHIDRPEVIKIIRLLQGNDIVYGTMRVLIREQNGMKI